MQSLDRHELVQSLTPYGVIQTLQEGLLQKLFYELVFTNPILYLCQPGTAFLEPNLIALASTTMHASSILAMLSSSWHFSLYAAAK